MSSYESTFASGGTRWFLQRITAAFLIVTLAFHFFLLHFVHHPAEITFNGAQLRMQQLGYFVTMVLFLVTATFHGLNGVYAALINQGLAGTKLRVAKWVIIVAGGLLIVQGLRVAIALGGF